MKEGLGTAGVSLIGFGVTATMFAGAPPWMATTAIAGGFVSAIAGAWSGHYTDMEKLFLNCNLYVKTKNNELIVPKKIKTIHKPYGKDFILSLPKGLCLDDFKKKEENISQALNSFVEFDYNNGILIMAVNNTQLHKTYPFVKHHTDEALGVILGYSRDGIVSLPLCSSPSPHLLIAGETNSGKSVILRGIITQLITDKSPDDLEIHLIDPKRVEFSIFRNSGFVKSFARDDAEISETIRYVVAETDRRYILLEKAGKVNIKDYNKKAKEKLKYVLVIIDEFADIEDKEMLESINYIARKARAVGIHLIVTTQRPDKDVVNGRIKANLGNILGLKTTTMVNSQLILDRPGAEKLRGFGHGILKSSGYTEIQSMMITPEQAEALTKHTFIKKQAAKQAEKVRGYIELGD